MITTIFTDNLVVKPDEKVLIAADEPMLEIAQEFLTAANEKNIRADLLSLPAVTAAGQPPDGFTASAFEGYACALLVTSKSLSHTAARRTACHEMGLRIASMPGITPDIIQRQFRFGYSGKIAAINLAIAENINNLNPGIIKVKSDKGTDFTLSVSGKKLYTDTGVYDSPGRFGNLPAGEIAWAPVNESASGTVVFDVAFAGVGSVDKLTMELEGSRVIDVAGDKSGQIRKMLLKESEKTLGEFGIGTNPFAIPGPITLEAEKAAGTVHLGFGDNRSFGGDNVASGHWDGVLMIDEMSIDGKVIDIVNIIGSYDS